MENRDIWRGVGERVLSFVVQLVFFKLKGENRCEIVV